MYAPIPLNFITMYFLKKDHCYYFLRKYRTHLDLLSIPQLRGGGMSKRVDGIIDRLQIQNLFMTFKRVPIW